MVEIIVVHPAYPYLGPAGRTPAVAYYNHSCLVRHLTFHLFDVDAAVAVDMVAVDALALSMLMVCVDSCCRGCD